MERKEGGGRGGKTGDGRGGGERPTEAENVQFLCNRVVGCVEKNGARSISVATRV